MMVKGQVARQYRLSLHHYELLDILQEKMHATVAYDVHMFNPSVTVSNVIDFALVLADKVMRPEVRVIRSDDFLSAVYSHLDENFEALKSLEPDQRKAMLEMLVIANSATTPFDPVRES